MIGILLQLIKKEVPQLNVIVIHLNQKEEARAGASIARSMQRLKENIVFKRMKRTGLMR